MSEQSTSLEVVRHEAATELGRPLPPMDDGEVAALWRQAKALADSGLFKGAKAGEALKAGQAFAKMLAGRDLGLTPFESMQQLHVLPDGKLEASSDLHATKVRQREGYDFEVWWVKSRTGKAYPPAEDGSISVPEGEREAVRASDEDPTDLRPSVGCAIVFTVDGERRGVSTWSVEDTLRANLQRDRGGKTSPHVSYPRSMYYARAMTNGVAWYVPEVMGGVRVYGLGELGKGESGEDLGAGTGQAPAMDGLPTAVEAVIARARELGHAGLANRERWATVAGQPAEQVGQAVARATRELNAYAARQRRGEPEAETEAAPEPPDAEVVQDPPTQNEAVSAPEDAGAPEPTGDPVDAPQEQSAPAERDESGEVVDAEAAITPAERQAGLREAAAQLLEDADAAEAEGQPEEAKRLRASAEEVIGEADGLGDPDQPSFDL